MIKLTKYFNFRKIIIEKKIIIAVIIITVNFITVIVIKLQLVIIEQEFHFNLSLFFIMGLIPLI